MDIVTARHSLPRVTPTMPNTIKLRSSDDETFEVDEDVALCVSTTTTRMTTTTTTTTRGI